MISGGIVYPYAQNVMFTLLLGLLCCGCVKKMQESGISPSGFIACVLFLLFAWMGELLGTDYGTAGILTVVLFYLVHGKRYGFVLEIIGMLFLHGVWLKGVSIRIDILLFTVSVPCQVFAVLAMVPIGMYNGKQGALSKGVRRIFYFFYPLHMLILFAAGLMI